MSNDIAIPPSVSWAQRKDVILLTFNVECKSPEIKFEEDSVYYKGSNNQDNKMNEVKIMLNDNIVPDKCNFVNKGRNIEMVLQKKNVGPFWPTLTKDKKKPHYLKVDFNKWIDEDDDDGDGAEDGFMGNPDLASMLASMKGNDQGAKPSFDDFESDSDDENLPDLQQ